MIHPMEKDADVRTCKLIYNENGSEKRQNRKRRGKWFVVVRWWIMIIMILFILISVGLNGAQRIVGDLDQIAMTTFPSICATHISNPNPNPNPNPNGVDHNSYNNDKNHPSNIFMDPFLCFLGSKLISLYPALLQFTCHVYPTIRAYIQMHQFIMKMDWWYQRTFQIQNFVLLSSPGEVVHSHAHANPPSLQSQKQSSISQSQHKTHAYSLCQWWNALPMVDFYHPVTLLPSICNYSSFVDFIFPFDCQLSNESNQTQLELNSNERYNILRMDTFVQPSLSNIPILEIGNIHVHWNSWKFPVIDVTLQDIRIHLVLHLPLSSPSLTSNENTTYIPKDAFFFSFPSNRTSFTTLIPSLFSYLFQNNDAPPQIPITLGTSLPLQEIPQYLPPPPKARGLYPRIGEIHISNVTLVLSYAKSSTSSNASQTLKKTSASSNVTSTHNLTSQSSSQNKKVSMEWKALIQSIKQAIPSLIRTTRPIISLWNPSTQQHKQDTSSSSKSQIMPLNFSPQAQYSSLYEWHLSNNIFSHLWNVTNGMCLDFMHTVHWKMYVSIIKLIHQSLFQICMLYCFMSLHK